MLDLTAKPFYLDETQINWVHTTLNAMTLEEKIGQLFMPIGYAGDAGYLENCLLRHHIGGVMYRSGEKAEMQATHRYLQEHSKIPLLIGSNLEAGGSGAAVEGTAYATQLQVAAAGDVQKAYELGAVSCTEGAAVGVNCAFAPVVDIDMNWRNPITNTRTYGADAAMVEACGAAYLRAAKERGVATTAKHFPGDGWDEVDQHILTSVNGLSCDEWDATYGKIYSRMIEDGTLGVMAGHIAQPAYQERLDPQTPKALVPATLSRALLQGLLRGKLGFNGLILSDSTCMVGFACAMERSLAVPRCIEAGCDIFLFNKDLQEDYNFMLQGYQNGVLTEARLQEALLRILATKAALGLHAKEKEDIVPQPDALSVVGCEAHKQLASQCVSAAICLEKDTQGLLPLDAKKHRRVLLQVPGDFPSSQRVCRTMAQLLQQNGFEVEEYKREDFETAQFDVASFRSKYDLVLYVANVENTSNMVTNRLLWYTFWGNGNNVPWFVKERPTLFVSVANPYHLVDVPMMQTYVNCFGNSDATLAALTERLLGRAAFSGKSPVDAFCGKEYLRY